MTNVASGLAGDYDGSGAVDGADVLAWQRQLGSPETPSGCGADGDGDGVVDSDDLSVWEAAFNAGGAAAAPQLNAATADSSVDRAAREAVYASGDVTAFFSQSRSARPLRRTPFR